MGLYLRRAVRVGPIRLNFSKSGIGGSVGLPGFRIGQKPDGSGYVFGRLAPSLYYRQSLGRHRLGWRGTILTVLAVVVMVAAIAWAVSIVPT